jgi:hypothetical protein
MSTIRSTSSRSDQVRSRQQQRTTERLKKSSQNVTHAASRPAMPVYSRSNIVGMNNTAPQQRARRQYYYSLGATGAEIRLPAIQTKDLGWRLLSAAILAFSFFALYFLFNSPDFQIQQLEAQGIQRLTTSDLNTVIDLQGKSIIYVNASKVQANLTEAFPELSNIQVSINLPNQVLITCTERQPVLAWKTENKTYWLDQEGVLIPPRGEFGELLTITASEEPPVLAVIAPVETEAAVTEQKLSAAEIEGWGRQVDISLVNAAFKLSLQVPQGTPILYNPEHGLGWEDPSGWDVYVGLTLNDIEYKLKAYQELIGKLGEEGITPSLVSFERLHAPFYRE